MNLSQTLFDVGSAIIMPFWLALILAPRSRVTRALMAGPWICALLAAMYGALVLPNAAELLPLLSRPTLEGVAGLLGSPLGAAAGWLHFLAFDLFVARWIWNDALETNRSSWLLRAVLPLTLMFGPLGLLAYLIAARTPWHRLRPLAKPPLISLSVTSVALVLVCLVGLAVDDRSVTNLPVWMKPLKFSLSLLFYCTTLELILARLGRSSLATGIRWVTAICLGVEILAIGVQAARGTTSHYNIATPLDTALFALMGLAIVPIWIAAMATTWLLFRDRTLEPGLATALRWGGLVSVVGMAWGWPMIVREAHTVGAPDGGPGIPLLGWSTVAGDLRVAHFLGLHGLQIMPLLWLTNSSRRAMHVHGLFLVTVMCWLGAQALEGRSILAPDPVLLLILAAWAVSGVGFYRSRPTASASPTRA